MRHGTFDAHEHDDVAVRPHTDSSPARRYFADEIAIDFPSVAAVVGRMRRAFVADLHPVALEASIHLSRREALAGTTVPLTVPVRSECTPCGGRGEAVSGLCGRCSGSGVVERRRAVRVRVPPGVRHDARFRVTLSPGRPLPTRIDLRVHVA
jgi:hypothetical protein